MSNEVTEQELADTIYSECGIEIRFCDCQQIAKRLLELYLITAKENENE